MALTDSLVTVADAIVAILEAKKVQLGIQDFYYGDQDRLPRSPAICVETGEKIRELNGAPRRTLVTLPVYLLVYHGALKAAAAGQRKENDVLAELIETELHKATNRDLGGIVIHQMVTALEPGYQRKTDGLWQTTQITITATSQVQLPS